MNQPLKLIGRIIFVLPIGIFGLFHFMMGGMMAGMVPKWLPLPALFWVYLTGVIMIAGAVFVIGNLKYASIAALINAALILIYILLIHLPVFLGGGSGAQSALMSILKDCCMLGGLLFFTGYLEK